MLSASQIRRMSEILSARCRLPALRLLLAEYSPPLRNAQIADTTATHVDLHLRNTLLNWIPQSPRLGTFCYLPRRERVSDT